MRDLQLGFPFLNKSESTFTDNAVNELDGFTPIMGTAQLLAEHQLN